MPWELAFFGKITARFISCFDTVH